MQAIIENIIEGLITAKEDEINDTKQIIEAHQKEWEKLEKEKEALQQLLAILPELDRAAFERNVTQGFNKEKPHYFASGGKISEKASNPAFNAATTFRGMVKTAEDMGYIQKQASKENSEEKINTANVAAWSRKEEIDETALTYLRTERTQSKQPLYVFDYKGKEVKYFYEGDGLKEYKVTEVKNPVALIPKPELLKYVRTQPSLFPEEKPVHVFESEGKEYEFYYAGEVSVSPEVLRQIGFAYIREIRDTTGVIYFFNDNDRFYSFKLRAPKQQGTNNF